MTNITSSELKMLYIEIVMIAIMGIFMYFYIASPIDQSASFKGASTQTTVVASDSSWSTTLIDDTFGLPFGVSALLIVSAVFLVPMTIMNTLTLARLAKDFLTQWV